MSYSRIGQRSVLIFKSGQEKRLPRVSFPFFYLRLFTGGVFEVKQIDQGCYCMTPRDGGEGNGYSIYILIPVGKKDCSHCCYCPQLGEQLKGVGVCVSYISVQWAMGGSRVAVIVQTE